MKISIKKSKKPSKGFSLIEALVTLVLIGILAKIAISNFAGAVPDSSRVVARQQQAVLQEALNCWLSRNLSQSGRTINDAFALYNSYSSDQKINNCLRPYLGEETLPPLGDPGTDESPTVFILENGGLTSAASRQINSTFEVMPWLAAAPAGALAQPDSNGPTIRFVTESPSNP
jgi:prepilin-type N-terminal cleavage/methylation domain-containing protein